MSQDGIQRRGSGNSLSWSPEAWKEGMDMQRVILIGCGQRGRHWGEILKDNPKVEMAAFVDTNPDTLIEFNVKYRGVPSFTRLEDALEKVEADFAVLVTPPWGHKEECLALFDAGLHVLAEKPLTLGMEDGVEVVEAADAAGLQLGLCLNFRYLPVSQTYREWMVEERLGTPSFSLYHYATNRSGVRPGGNRYPLILEDAMLIDQSIHHFDLFRYCLNTDIAAVTASTWNPSWSPYAGDAVVSTTFEMENGMHCVYLGSWTGGWNNTHVNWRTDCSDGIIIMQKIHSDLAYARMSDPTLTDIPLADEEPYIDDTQHLLKNFIAALEGTEPLECSGRDHLRTLGPTLACIQSREERRTISMDEFYRQYGADRLFK